MKVVPNCSVREKPQVVCRWSEPNSTGSTLRYSTVTCHIPEAKVLGELIYQFIADKNRA